LRLDLSADVGEGADDLPLFPYLTSVSVGCGVHAGDAATMEACVAEAKRLGVSVGAHPSYPDRENYGRLGMAMEPGALAETLRDQIGTLSEICERHGVALKHVKPHGALYNQAATDPALASVVAGAVHGFDPGLVLIGLAGSAMLIAARAAGLAVAAEAFADRRYNADGTLASRGQPGALIEEPARAAAQAIAIARHEPITAADGTPITIDAQTICLHSDTPGALDIARAVRAALEDAGVEVAPLSVR